MTSKKGRKIFLNCNRIYVLKSTVSLSKTLFIFAAVLAALASGAPDGVRDDDYSIEDDSSEELQGREVVATNKEEEGEITNVENHESKRMKRTASDAISSITSAIHEALQPPPVEYKFVPIVHHKPLKKPIELPSHHDISLPLLGKVSLPKLALPASLSSLSSLASLSSLSSKLSSSVALPIVGSKVSLPLAVPLAVKTAKVAVLKAPLAAPVAIVGKKKLAAAAFVSHKLNKFS